MSNHPVPERNLSLLKRLFSSFLFLYASISLADIVVQVVSCKGAGGILLQNRWPVLNILTYEMGGAIITQTSKTNHAERPYLSTL